MYRGTMRSLLTPLHLPDNTPGGGGGPLFHQMPIESGTPDRLELSEAECDIDTIKKLKLGMRSSLWSRPQQNNSAIIANSGLGGVGTGGNGGGGGGIGGGGNVGPGGQVPGGHPSDYSIAV